ncbi:MAG: hypothetical protein COT43_00015 [Candidatus Marinimicrobia bacterium CG08_land_8_20_14_0_20_45_22]|nr:MAG: hypothetical protein COT43_00015 [Candidatus Marinimicrobia bacterium CG08_land_8_20_14_0_20_45_22]
MSAIRVMFIGRSPNLASTRVRVANLLEPLSHRGVRAELHILPRLFCERLKLFRKSAAFDIVVLQKKLLSPLIFFFLRQASRCLVYDFDDAVFVRDAFGFDNAAKIWISKSRQRRFKRTVRNVDLVLAGNAYLENIARKFNPNVAVLPSPVSLTNHPTRNDFPDNPKPVVGWIGSRTTLKYILSIESILARVAAVHPFELRIISDTPCSVATLTCHHIPWSLEQQDLEIAHFDVGLMPLSDDPWTNGKCAYKILQYMAAEVPFVASAVGMNVEVACGNTTGYAVRSDREFADSLIKLLDDKALRRQMGEAGRAFVEQHYTVEVIADKLTGLLKNLVSS